MSGWGFGLGGLSGGFCPGGGVLSGGLCPGGFCPDTLKKALEKQVKVIKQSFWKMKKLSAPKSKEMPHAVCT